MSKVFISVLRWCNKHGATQLETLQLTEDENTAFWQDYRKYGMLNKTEVHNCQGELIDYEFTISSNGKKLIRDLDAQNRNRILYPTKISLTLLKVIIRLSILALIATGGYYIATTYLGW